MTTDTEAFDLRCKIVDLELLVEVLRLRIVELESHIRYNEEMAP